MLHRTSVEGLGEMRMKLLPGPIDVVVEVQLA